MIQTFHASAGESLMEAMHRAGAKLNAPCGGNHSCGQCRVKVLEGTAQSVSAEEKRLLSEQELADGWRLACAVYGPGEWKIDVPEQDAGARVMTGGSEDDVEIDPVSVIRCVPVEMPTLEDQRADVDRVAAGAKVPMDVMKKLQSKALKNISVEKKRKIWVFLF